MNFSNIDMITIDEEYDLDIEKIEKLIEAGKPKAASFDIPKNHNEDYYDYYDTIKLVHELENVDDYDDYYQYSDEENIIENEPSTTTVAEQETEIINNFCNNIYLIFTLKKI